MRVSEMISGVTSAVAIKIYGDDMEQLEKKSKEIEALVGGIDGAIDVSRTPLRGQMYLSIRMNHAEMSRLGISVEDVNSLVAAAIGGVETTEVIEGNRRVPVIVRYPQEHRQSAAAISGLMLTAPGGQRSGSEMSPPSRRRTARCRSSARAASAR